MEKGWARVPWFRLRCGWRLRWDILVAQVAEIRQKNDARWVLRYPERVARSRVSRAVASSPARLRPHREMVADLAYAMIASPEVSENLF